MATKQILLTQEDHDKLVQELEYLKTTRRQEIAEKIKEARSFGDLSENAEYDEAKNEQGIVEARIAEIEVTLKNVKVVDESEINTEHVSIGNTVVIEDESGTTITFSLVGSSGIDLKSMKISDESPIGKACMGKTVGTVVDVEAPAGVKRYTIKEITITKNNAEGND